MTLTDFLTARFDEDRKFWDSATFSGPKGYDLRVRMRAEVEAKRQIVEFAASHRSMAFGGATSSIMDWPCRVLATVYADHPDYRQEWKP